jgi:ribosome maturation factor RimP
MPTLFFAVSSPGGIGATSGITNKTTSTSSRMSDTPSRKPAAPRIGPELWNELESIADAGGCELVHAELRGGTLRLTIDRPESPSGEKQGERQGVTLADCEHVSKQVSAFLDVLDFGRERYVLEVSSPGLDRQLYRPKDYQRFVGSKVKVTFLEPDGGKKRTVVGRLEEMRPAGPAGAEGEITVATEGGETLDLPLPSIQVARLEIEL